MILNRHNPDVLMCLANLSNDEVFTPPKLANQMLDTLPEELWSNPDAKFLDPFCKSGVFLREITKRLIKGLEHFEPDLQKRVNHIMEHQVYGIGITELTALMTRRSLYCTKNADGKHSVTNVFDIPEGNVAYDRIEHTFQNGKCTYCGASQEVYDRGDDLETHAYQFIHNNNPFENMQFDVIIGNPPYQLSDGGSGNGISARPIYHFFVEQAKKLNPRYMSMIIPSRWFAGGKGLNEFRENMINDRHIRVITDYPKSRDCFAGVDIAGGVCYFLWDRENEGDCEFISIIGDVKSRMTRKLNEFNIVIRDNAAVNIIHKIKAKNETCMDNTVYSRNTFGFVSSDRGLTKGFTGAVKLYSSAGIGYVNIEDVTKNKKIINDYKVSIGKLNPDRAGVNNASDGMMNVITKIRVLNPNEIVTESYLILFSNIEKSIVDNCAKYFSTKFVRYLISQTLSSMNISRDSFQFVPLQDFSETWTDEKLYKKYNLTQEEIDFIESMIRPMD